MPYHQPVAVIGTAIIAPAKGENRSLEELLYDIVQKALRDAEITIDDVDGIVVASNDQFDGRAIAVMAASGSVGGVDRDILSTPSAAEHAFVMGVLRVASGQYRTQLIVSWSPTEASSLSEAQRLGADPYFHRALPLDDLASHGLQAASLGNKVPEAHELALSIVAKNRRNGARAYPDVDGSASDVATIAASRPVRWPLRDGMVAPAVPGAVALVIASDDFITERKSSSPAWIQGMGWTTEAGFLGDRDLSCAPALETACNRAYREARIEDAINAFDVAEVSDQTPYQELMAYEGLGLASRTDWARAIAVGTFEIDGSMPVNPSGGAITINPVFCAGLIRIAEAANQTRGRAEKHQVPNVKRALAHAASGFAMQYQTVVVLGGERGDAQ